MQVPSAIHPFVRLRSLTSADNQPAYQNARGNEAKSMTKNRQIYHSDSKSALSLSADGLAARLQGRKITSDHASEE